MKIYIDNILLQFPQDSLQKPVFTLRRKDEEGTPAYSFTNDLVFIGTDYDYIYQRLKTDANALNNKVILKFVDDCCTPNYVVEFAITYESLQWCEGSCELTAAAIENSNDSDQITCLKNTLIFDNWNNFQGQKHPRFGYCNELRPSWLHDCVLIFAIILNNIMGALLPVLLVLGVLVVAMNAVIAGINFIVGAINGLITAINTIPGISVPTISLNLSPIDFDGDPTTTVFEEIKAWHSRLMSFAVGCGRKHPAPLVRDYAENVCGKCGIQFSSSIFKNASSPYHNTCYHYAPIQKGVDVSDTTTYWIDQNKPILNGTKFFDQLKGLFNADWQVRNNTLYFERRDFFTPSAPWVDTNTLDPDEYTICYSWSKETRYSYGNFAYQKDAANWVGSEANERWSDIVEWNNPYTPRQKGAFEPLFEFTTCRFRDDGIDRDVISAYANIPFIFSPSFGSLISKFNNYILLNSHTCYTAMLLIWDTNTPASDAKVSPVDYYFPGYPGVSGNQFYNYPFWFNKDYPGNMYDNFWAINDPRSSNYQGIDYTLTVPITCQRLSSIDLYGQINTPEGIGKIEEINVDYARNEITIKGRI